MFDPASQSTRSWVAFTAVLAVVLAILYQVQHSACCSKDSKTRRAGVCSMQTLSCHSGRTWHVLILLHLCDGQVWIAPGSGLADDFFAAIESVSVNPEVVMVAVFAVFALVHSGLAALRPQGTSHNG